MKSKRIHHLITTKGMTFKELTHKPKKELLTQSDYSNTPLKMQANFQITSGDDASGALIAISSLVLTDKSDAEIVEFLSILSNEFGTEGTFSKKQRKEYNPVRTT